jgi:hypothetical protein
VKLATLRRRLERNQVDAVVARERVGRALTGEEQLRAKRLASSLDLSWKPLAESDPAAAELFAWLGVLPAGLASVLLPLAFGETGEESAATLLRFNLAEIRGWDRRLVLPAPIRWYAQRKLGDRSEDERRTRLAGIFAALAVWL